MAGGEKGRERKRKKQEFMTIKLKQGVLMAKNGGNCTTPSPSWRYGFAEPDGSFLVQSLKSSINPATLSARRLGANLWEVLPYLRMNKEGPSISRRDKHNRSKDKGYVLPNQLEEALDSLPEQPKTESSLRRQVAASLVQHYGSAEKNCYAPKVVSPAAASYNSSMEVTPYNPAATPSSSLEFKNKFGDANCSLKTSTELLKILNRIWCLEEQHASNTSLVKAMKKELEHSQARIRELSRERRSDRQEMDALVRQMAEDKISRKTREHDRIEDAIQSMRNEVEGERELRKHSETIHRKLCQELSEVKSSFSNALKELARERKARGLLEDLCDEFAQGIKDYEQEVRFLKHKSEKDQPIQEHSDRLILHISEAWLDERMQMNLAEATTDQAGKNTIVDKLVSEIECFLIAKKSACPGHHNEVCLENQGNGSLPKHSVESFKINEATSAPRQDNDDEESTGGAPHCFELKRGSRGKQNKKNEVNAKQFHLEETTQSNPLKKAHAQQIVALEGISQFEGHIAEGIPGNESRTNLIDSNNILEKKVGCSSDCPEDYVGGPEFKGHANSMKKWMSRLTAPDPQLSESSSKWSKRRGMKEKTLKAKLLEARLESQQFRSKSSKTSS